MSRLQFAFKRDERLRACGQAIARHGREQSSRRERRILEIVAKIAQRGHHLVWRGFEKVEDKGVWMLRLDPVT